MRAWHRELDLVPGGRERIVSAKMSQNEIVPLVMTDTGLACQQAVAPAVESAGRWRARRRADCCRIRPAVPLSRRRADCCRIRPAVPTRILPAGRISAGAVDCAAKLGSINSVRLNPHR
jgi:hypothetical protein